MKLHYFRGCTCATIDGEPEQLAEKVVSALAERGVLGSRP